MAPYLYSPHLHFKLSLNSFINYIKQLVSKIEDKYDIKTPGKIVFRLVFHEEDRPKISQYEIIYPITQDVKQRSLLKDLEMIKNLREIHEKEVAKLDEALEIGQEKIGRIKDSFTSEINFITMKLNKIICPVKVIDRLIPSLNERLKIKEALINSIVEARVKLQNPSLQKVLGVFLNKLEVFTKDIFIIYLRAAITLIRWLNSKHLITLTKNRRYAPYLIDFSEEKEKTAFKQEFYRDKVFFSIKEYDPDKSGISQDLSYIELTPIKLSHDYFKYIKGILNDIEEGSEN